MAIGSSQREQNSPSLHERVNHHTERLDCFCFRFRDFAKTKSKVRVEFPRIQSSKIGVEITNWPKLWPKFKFTVNNYQLVLPDALYLSVSEQLLQFVCTVSNAKSNLRLQVAVCIPLSWRRQITRID